MYSKFAFISGYNQNWNCYESHSSMKKYIMKLTRDNQETKRNFGIKDKDKLSHETSSFSDVPSHFSRLKSCIIWSPDVAMCRGEYALYRSCTALDSMCEFRFDSN